MNARTTAKNRQKLTNPSLIPHPSFLHYRLPTLSQTNNHPSSLPYIPSNPPQTPFRRRLHLIYQREKAHPDSSLNIHHPPSTDRDHPRYPRRLIRMDRRILARSLFPPNPCVQEERLGYGGTEWAGEIVGQGERRDRGQGGGEVE